MQRRRLGGLEVSGVGLGCATMTPFYDEPDRDSAIDTLRRTREIGVNFLDSSDAYSQGRNEELIAILTKRRHPPPCQGQQPPKSRPVATPAAPPAATRPSPVALADRDARLHPASRLRRS